MSAPLTPQEARCALVDVRAATEAWGRRSVLERHLGALDALLGEGPMGSPSLTIPSTPAEAAELVAQIEDLLRSRISGLSATARHEREAIGALARVVLISLRGLSVPCAPPAASVGA